MEHITEGAFAALQLSFFSSLFPSAISFPAHTRAGTVCVLCVQQETSLLTVYEPHPDFALSNIPNQLNITASLQERKEMPPWWDN